MDNGGWSERSGWSGAGGVEQPSSFSVHLIAGIRAEKLDTIAAWRRTSFLTSVGRDGRVAITAADAKSSFSSRLRRCSGWLI